MLPLLVRHRDLRRTRPMEWKLGVKLDSGFRRVSRNNHFHKLRLLTNPGWTTPTHLRNMERRLHLN